MLLVKNATKQVIYRKNNIHIFTINIKNFIYYIVLCKCKPNYGSEDCSVNVYVEPEFEIAEKCCDSRSMSCAKLTGISKEKLSTTNKLDILLRLKVKIKFLFNIFVEFRALIYQNL